MTKYKFILFLLLIFQGTILFGQNDRPDFEMFLMNLAEYRADLMMDKELDELGSLYNIIASMILAAQDKEELDDFIFNTTFAAIIKKNDFKSFRKYVERYEENKNLVKVLDEKHYAIFRDNIELFQLISEGVLELYYPFKIRPFELQSELGFYQIGNGDRIGEIGGGTGVFARLVLMMGLDVEYYFNEIDHRLIQFQEYLGNEGIFPSYASDYRIVKGSAKSSNFPEKLDKIIVRNAFHHFSRKRKMLVSIYDSLVEDGELYILATLNTESSCPRVMEQSRILKKVTSRGFVLDQKKEIPGAILYRFVKG